MNLANRILVFLMTCLVFVSCQDDEKQRAIEQLKQQNKQDEVFETINTSWNFNGNALNASSQKLVQNWAEWRTFLAEINQKPKSSIGAFKKKAKTLSKRVAELNNNLPEPYNKPEVRSRISALTAKINSLSLYINLQNIPEKKLLAVIPAINEELQSLQLQFSEIDQKNQIKMEDGEVEMIRMLDTTRAIPSSNVPKNQDVSPVDPSAETKKRMLEKSNLLNHRP